MVVVDNWWWIKCGTYRQVPRIAPLSVKIWPATRGKLCVIFSGGGRDNVVYIQVPHPEKSMCPGGLLYSTKLEFVFAHLKSLI